jgi:prevent-host-death family protein
METVNIFEAKTHLSRLLERVQKGEEITLAKAGVPIAKLVPLAAPKRELGFLRAAVAIDAAQLMAPLDDESLADWEQGAP